MLLTLVSAVVIGDGTAVTAVCLCCSYWTDQQNFISWYSLYSNVWRCDINITLILAMKLLTDVLPDVFISSSWLNFHHFCSLVITGKEKKMLIRFKALGPDNRPLFIHPPVIASMALTELHSGIFLSQWCHLESQEGQITTSKRTQCVELLAAALHRPQTFNDEQCRWRGVCFLRDLHLLHDGLVAGCPPSEPEPILKKSFFLRWWGLSTCHV